jgi:hypothetical protein
MLQAFLGTHGELGRSLLEGTARRLKTKCSSELTDGQILGIGILSGTFRGSLGRRGVLIEVRGRLNELLTVLV